MCSVCKMIIKHEASCSDDVGARVEMETECQVPFARMA